MLLLLLVWIVLLIPMLIAGTRLMLAAAPAPPASRDSAFLAVWLGLLAIANILLALALAGPLTVLDLALVLLSASAVGLVHGPTRLRMRQYLRGCVGHGGAAIACVIVFVAAAATAAMPVSLYDTGLYHYPQLNWLAVHGDSPGLALLHFRFASVTSWLTIPASLDHGVLAGRTSTLLNGFVLALVVAQLVVSLARWRLGTSDCADRFWVCAVGGAAAYAVATGFVNSASPDLPVFFLPSLIVAATLRGKPGDVPGSIFLLALLMFTIKLSTLPVVAVTGAFVAWRVPPWSLVKWAGAAAIIVAPMVVTGFAVSGCLLFPIDSTCFDLSWSLPPHSAAAAAQITTEWARWNGPRPAEADIATWWTHWGARKSNLVLILLLALSLAAGLALRQQLNKNVSLAISVLLAICGIGYVVVLAPDLRFAIGYLVILPALFIARLGHFRGGPPAPGRHRSFPARWYSSWQRHW